MLINNRQSPGSRVAKSFKPNWTKLGKPRPVAVHEQRGLADASGLKTYDDGDEGHWKIAAKKHSNVEKQREKTMTKKNHNMIT